MGTLASIAIPAYNEYRKSAKKNAYRADLSSLHKGWLAFGVEIDSFCERDTAPSDASFGNIGMQSLVTSKLYGNTNATATNANCDVSGTPTPANLRPTGCTASTAGSCASCSAGTFSPYIPAGNGPGKANFIGFGDIAAGGNACPNISAVANAAHFLQDVGATTDAHCTLGITAYKMGVFGHVGGTQYIGINMTNTGVVVENEGAPTQSWLAVGDFAHTCT